MRIAIRTDASVALGLGHIKRCLSLADALRTAGADVRFFGRAVDVDCMALVAAAGFGGQSIGSGPVSDELADARELLESSREWKPAVVLVDHYSLGAEWHRRVKQQAGARLVAIADQADRPLAVDLLVDHNFAADHRAKYGQHVPVTTPILGGPQYALLASTYSMAPRCALVAEVASIGIFMGGTDAVNLSSVALEACREHVGFDGPIEIATTHSNPNLADLRELAGRRPGTSLSLDQPSLAAFFARHGLQIGAGGGATWERCCIGAPTLAMIAADNQRDVVLPLQALGVLQVVTEVPPTAQDIAPALQPLLADAQLRNSLGTTARRLVDGRGASRVADRIMQL